MKILVTGATGFLGSNLSKLLLNQGHEVLGLDDLSTSSPQNLGELNAFPNFSFFQHDVRNPYDFEAEFVINFACPASPIHYQHDPVKTIETNFNGMKNALTLARNLKIPIMQASTSEVYGDPLISPQTEEYWGNVNPIGIRSCYDEGKRAAETLCFDYKRQFGVDVRVVRIFNTYGPGMAKNDGRVVSNLIVQALENQSLTIYGDGTQTRSFCYVSDLTDGFLKILNLKNAPDNPINLGNPNEITMLNLANIIIDLTRSSSEIAFAKLPNDDPKQRKPDISRANHELKWYPKIHIKRGLDETIKYFKKII